MLAQTFKSARDLDLGHAVYEALKDVLVKLENKELVYWDYRGGRLSKSKIPENGFSMTNVLVQEFDEDGNVCGTIGCIAGWISEGRTRAEATRDSRLAELFFPGGGRIDYNAITVEQAAQTLRNYLETGKIDWMPVLKAQKLLHCKWLRKRL